MAENYAKDSQLISGDSVMGEVRVADEVVSAIAAIAVCEVEGVISIAGDTPDAAGMLGVKGMPKGLRVDIKDEGITVDVSIHIASTYNIPEISENVQERVKSAVESMTGLTVLTVNVKIAGVEIA